MELLIELIFEFIFEGVLEVTMDGMESKKVPMPLRILLGVVLIVAMCGIAALFIWIGTVCDSVLVWVLLMTILVLLAAGLFWKIWKIVKKRNQ